MPIALEGKHLHTVEIGLIGDDVAVFMGLMRTWLDHHRFEPDSFRQVLDNRGTRFQLEFKFEGEAAAFAAAFGGRV